MRDQTPPPKWPMCVVHGFTIPPGSNDCGGGKAGTCRTDSGTEITQPSALCSGIPRLSAKETMRLYKRVIDENLWRIDLCAITCKCGPNGEPLACGYKRDHPGDHSWATLPTFARAE